MKLHAYIKACARRKIETILHNKAFFFLNSLLGGPSAYMTRAKKYFVNKK